MNRKILLLPLAFLISSCSSIEKPDCFKSVAVSKVAIDQVFISAADASESEIISVDDAIKALTILDTSNKLADNAGALCKIDEKTAFDYLDLVSKSLKDVNSIVKGI